jgi:uncharacterized protein (DUF433 family)
LAGETRSSIAERSRATNKILPSGSAVCGGDACIRGTRITVWGLVQRRQLGLADTAISESIQGGLQPADLEAAWECAAAHPHEIEEAIRRNTEA